MKRFVTYLYEYRDGEKQKNKGHIRVDVRGQVLDMTFIFLFFSISIFI